MNLRWCTEMKKVSVFVLFGFSSICHAAQLPQVDSSVTPISVYDAHGHLLSVTDANGLVTTYAYDQAGNRRTQIDPQGRVTSWTYDSRNNLLSKSLPTGEREVYHPDVPDRDH